MRAEFVAILLSVLAAQACLATAAPRHSAVGEPTAAFPARGELELLSARPATPKAPLSEVDVERWQLEATPLPAALGFWQRLLAEHFALSGPTPQTASDPRVRLAPELDCAAREMARFYVEHGGYPSEGLRDFMALRCGSTLPKLSVGTLHSSISDRVGDAELEQQLAPSVQRLLEQLPREGDVELGIGFARGHGRGAVVVFSGQAKARVLDFSPIVSGNGVTLRGEILGEASLLLTLVNQGPLDAQACEADRSVPLPRFQVYCAFAPGDSATRVEFAVRRPKRVLFDTVARALLRRSESDGLVYQPTLFGSDELAPDAHAFSESLYVSLNEARKAAGRGTLAIEAKQASTNERLAPQLFEGFLADDRALSDRIALGLLAGWEVEGAIRDGAFLAGSNAGERRPARWLAAQLESPLARFLLLDPTASQVAAGATELAPAGTAAAVTVYSLFHASDHERDQARLLTELTQSRAAQNKRRPRFLPASPELQAALLRIEKERISALAALQDTLADLSASSEPLRGWAIETNDLRQIDWPAELLTPTRLDVEVGLTHYKPKGGAWGQYAIVFVIHQSEREARVELERPRIRARIAGL